MNGLPNVLLPILMTLVCTIAQVCIIAYSFYQLYNNIYKTYLENEKKSNMMYLFSSSKYCNMQYYNVFHGKQQRHHSMFSAKYICNMGRRTQIQDKIKGGDHCVLILFCLGHFQRNKMLKLPTLTLWLTLFLLLRKKSC